MQGGCTAHAWSSIEPMHAGHAVTSSIHGGGATVGQALRLGMRRDVAAGARGHHLHRGEQARGCR